MFEILSNVSWPSFHKDIYEILTYPGVQLQLYLAALALMVAVVLSWLIGKITKRKLPVSGKYGWIERDAIPTLLLPFMVIVLLAAAGWLAALLIPFKSHAIAGITKIASVWFLARLLLLIAQRHFMAYLISWVMLALTLLSVTNLLASTQASLNEIAFEASNFRLSLLGAIKGIFMCIVLFWGAGVLSKTGEKWLHHFHLSFNARELVIKFLRITLYCVATILTLNEMGVDLTALTVFGGAFAVGLGFGLQKITSNFISGIILLFEKTIQAGDLIEVGGEKGWVRQMAIRHTLIETSDGREMLIPNEDLIVGKVTNWTYTNTRARIDISLTVTYESDVDLVQKLLLKAAKGYTYCLSDPSPACHLREFNDKGLQFMLIFWIADIKAGMAAAKSDVMFSIVRAFREHNIIFAVKP
jgi:small-conductance mechanosensitive channel